ncbi:MULTISPECIES: TetR/AcrR family transcriptional regulator [Streptomyces]|uniref:TetR family transcriptional regulator n=1 Tax=Streptomyces canarius TaxID=285453 RepID=A0ABQ3CS95_9ACTN|nr:TetR/AcrR family transcriptional regulator C-terminal domain-containing protein [Streptomyces canarius]GHA39309.1 TetR family transcriptional regulator [Streptomyces canarius]
MAERDKPERRRRLSRPVVLAAAVALVDREGLAALTMRRLAADLGVEPTAPYRYTDGEEGLFDGLMEVFFAEVNERLRTSVERARADAAGEPHWRTELRRIARAFAGVVHAHPEVLPVVAVRPLAVPVARRPEPWLQLTEHMFAVLARAGFDDPTALTVYRTFVSWTLGCLLVDKRQAVDNPEEPDPVLRLGLHRLSAADYPRLRALVPHLADYDDERDLTNGLDSLLSRMPEAPRDAFYGPKGP